MKEIPLTQGKVALVDDEDFEFLNQWKWFAHKKNNSDTFYARRSINFKRDGRKCSKSIMMHRAIMGLSNGMQIDHIDHNGLNNIRSNIRFCNASQNGMNRRPKNQYIGVTKTKWGKYQSYLQYNKKFHYLGVFNSPIEAAIARDNAAKKYFGRFAYLNIKPKEEQP